MKIKSKSIFAVMLCFFFLSPVIATEVSGQVIGFSCNGCHGSDGHSVKSGLPKLKLRPSKELENILLSFKYDRKPSSIMGRISKGYTDGELKAVALYFSRLE